ncbi:MAG TPA: hypothetical protein VFL77_02910 [Solirubrobacterales bacterium]|nr:hypothetical protein [Solirubrobacterales bacterium]
MTPIEARLARFGMTLFALALGALALLAMPGLAAAKDRNHDHIPDRWEKRHHLSLKVDQARKNQDGDALNNRAEFLAGDNPRDADSNNDGVEDGEDNAGTIVSFDAETGKLVINLFGGETVSGLVNEGTEIKCEDRSGASVSSDGGGESRSGEDDGGEGEAEPGDDNGGVEQTGDDDGGQAEEEPGDDNGGEEADDDNAGPGNGNCTAADLAPGAVVQEAELKVAGGQATFEEVELSGRDA